MRGCFAVGLFLILVLLTGCEGRDDAIPQATTSVNPEDYLIPTEPSEVPDPSERPEAEAFLPPAHVADVDLDSPDPSTDSIRFTYDEQGRIDQCYYSIGERDYALSYSYEDGNIHIWGFSDSIIVADERFEAKADYDASVSFCEYSGYYFKGFEADGLSALPKWYEVGE